MKEFIAISKIGLEIVNTETREGEIKDYFLADEVSDGYHTMHELYEHRMALNVFLFKMMFKLDEQVRGEKAWSQPNIMRSMLHHDGTMFDGYFIVLANTIAGQISYHYKVKHWDKFIDLPIVPKIPVPFDGHGSREVIERLMKL